jgi:hypothetical protein
VGTCFSGLVVGTGARVDSDMTWIFVFATGKFRSKGKGGSGHGPFKHRFESDCARHFAFLLPEASLYCTFFSRSSTKYVTVFGKWNAKGVFSLEAQPNLPKRMYSYLLQRWMTLWGVNTAYDGALEFVEDFLGLDEVCP